MAFIPGNPCFSMGDTHIIGMLWVPRFWSNVGGVQMRKYSAKRTEHKLSAHEWEGPGASSGDWKDPNLRT